MTRTRALVTLGIAAALAATLVGCRDPLGPQADRLAEARARWAASAPASYAYDYRNLCYCGLIHIRITVADGEVVSVESLGEEPVPDVPERAGYTVEELFDRIGKALDRDPHEARLSFDPDRGHPLEVWFDFEEHTADEEWGFELENFTVLD